MTRLVEPDVIACALELQRLTVLLEKDVRLGHRLEFELLAVQRDLRQARLDLLDSQIHRERAQHTAFHDALTGLPNRTSFEERSSRALALHEPQAREFGLIYIDLDDFKSINDVHGHGVGDELLKVIGWRLIHAVRMEDSIGRHGGDEFVCLLPDVQSEEQIASIARKLFDAISAPCVLGALTLCVQPSIGAALYPRDGTTVEALLQSADSAMFWAKSHRLGHAFYSQVPEKCSFQYAGRTLPESTTKQPPLPEARDRVLY
ncbi:hypothetical protein GCM10009105_10390 [Dokdonella soli]|uniref:GGDEF domain-containing protein n=1 Tax=Dokdonella soli TaxID=529810 RepID=A0ABN1IDY0_9GAMM